MKELILHLIENPKEAEAVVRGLAEPIGVTASELNEVINLFTTMGNVPVVMGYWG